MNDDELERELRGWFDSQAVPAVPASLHRYLLDLPRSNPTIHRVARRSPILAIAPRRDLALVFLAAAAVVALGAGLIAGFGPWKSIPPATSPLGSQEVSVPPSSVPPSSVPPSLGPTSPPATGPYRWTLVSSTGEVATYAVEAAIRRSDGSLLAAAFGQETRMLTSRDGHSWSVEPADPGLLQATANHISLVTGLAEGSGTLVAVGATALDDISSGDARAWTSVDGVRWQVAPTSIGMIDAEMEAVTAGPDGFVAVGSDGFPGGSTQLPNARGAAVWVSSDGRAWTRAPSQASFEGAVMFGVRRTTSGYVAWGEIHDPAGSGPELPPIWTSTDGLHWDRGTGISDAGGPGNPIASITTVGDRLIAVGSRVPPPDSADGIEVAAAWQSNDGGRTWTLAKSPDSGDSPGPGYLRSVAVSGSDLLAVGLAAPSLGGAAHVSAYVAIAWRSTDQGATWVSLPDEQSLAASIPERVIGTDGGFVVFGSANDPNSLSQRSLIWLAEVVVPINPTIVPVSASDPEVSTTPMSQPKAVLRLPPLAP